MRCHLVAKTTKPEDAAERYYCLRTRRTLWVEPDLPKDRSCDDAPRYIVDNGDGSRTFYSGEDFSVAMERLLSVGRPERRRTEAIPTRLAPRAEPPRTRQDAPRGNQSTPR